MKKDVYERIRNRRLYLEMSQQELAELTGYKSGKSMIAKIEKGEVDLPLNKIELFATALKCDAAYLMGWDRPAEPSEENAEVLADLMKDECLIGYVKKILKLDIKKKEQLYNFIDFLLNQ